ncbi:MAG: tetraacyldisaccharide 4'-kinase [Planctomycetaceae bacterium]|nr:tetraacyldisaccharide 4'-kinase [Planctomycetaceae bacterium]
MEHEIRTLLEGGAGPVGTLVRAALWLPGKLYGGAMTLRRRGYERGLFRRYRPPVPVVSVGNITAGGSGKTPFVVLLARLLAEAGQRPAILLRGYRETAAGDSDEALLYNRQLPGIPVLVGRDRCRSAEAAVRDGATVLVMDDGMQHLRLDRTLDIVLVDATSPWGGGNTFPGGLLREPLSALRVAGAVVVTRSDQAPPDRVAAIRSRLAVLAPGARVFIARHAPVRLHDIAGATLNPSALDGREVVALSGIARPEAFAATLTSCGGRVVRSVNLPDHADIPPDVVASCLAEAVQRGAVVVTTEKDEGKIRRFLGAPPRAGFPHGVWGAPDREEPEERREALYSNVIRSGDAAALWVLGVDQEVRDLPEFREVVLRRLFP